MATRLNKTMVDEIITSVLASTTFQERRAALEKRVRAHARAMLERDAPPGLVALSKTVPREWLQWTESVWTGNAEWNPYKILGRAFESAQYYGGHCIQVEPAVPTTAHHKDEVHEADFVELTAEATALAEAYLRAKSQLRAVLNSVRTVEQVLERMPELAPHIPRAVKAYPLATTSNLLTDLMAFGFDTKNPGVVERSAVDI